MKTFSISRPRDRVEHDIGRRQLPDRRRTFSGVNLRHLGLGARRQTGRRSADNIDSYVDWYEARLLFSGLGIVVCCCLDAFFTLTLLQMGAVELNALMAGLIEANVQSFVNYKVGVTCLSVVLLIIHNKFRIFNRLRVEYLLHSVLLAYLALIGWELQLLAHPPL